MNDNTARLIEQLAQKLGTTTEYLWAVLLKQAAIDATTTLLQSLAVVFASWMLWRTHKRLMVKEKVGSFTETGYERKGEGVIVAMGLAAFACMILLIVCFCAIGDIVNGYFNPEYWALKKILDSVGY